MVPDDDDDDDAVVSVFGSGGRTWLARGCRNTASDARPTPRVLDE